MHNSKSLLLFSFFVAFLLILSSLSVAKTIYVDCKNIEGPWDGTIEHPVKSIQDGMCYATSGDTIYVFNGTYAEAFLIDFPLNLIGENKTTTRIIATFPMFPFELQSNNITFSGFTIESNFQPSNLLLMKNCQYSRINDIIFTTGNNINFYGILAINSSRIVISNCKFGSHFANAGPAIWLNNCSHCNIFGNTIVFYMAGITLSDNSNDNVIIKNYNTGATSISNSDRNFVEFNDLLLLRIIQGKQNEITHNNFAKWTLQLYKDKGPQVSFTDSTVHFDGNYWGRARMFPKLLFSNHHLEIDWHPARHSN